MWTNWSFKIIFRFLRGPGRFSLFDYFLWRKMSASRNFFLNGKISLAKVITFLNHENTHNYIACSNSNRDSPKINLKIHLLLRLWDKFLKLGNYVLGTKTKLSRDQTFDWGLKNENIEFWKLPVLICEGFWATGNYQNSIFTLLRLLVT